MEIIGSGYTAPAAPALNTSATGAGLGDALGGMLGMLVPRPQSQAAQNQAFELQDRIKGQQYLGQLFASAFDPNSPGIDPGVVGSAIAHGMSPEQAMMAAQVGATMHSGVDSPVNARIATATNHYPSTPLSQQRAEAATAANATQAQAAVAANEAAARSGAPVNYVMADGSIFHGTAGSAPAGAQPLVSTDESKAAIAQHGILPQPGGAQPAGSSDDEDTPGPVSSAFSAPQPAFAGAPAQPAPIGSGMGAVFNTPAPAPAAAPASSASGLTADQRSFVGLDKAEKVQNYQVLGPDGKQAAVGVTTDGKTDYRTGQPLPQNATLGTAAGQTINVNNGAETAEQSELGKAKGATQAGYLNGEKDAQGRLSLLTQMADAARAAGPNMTTGPFADMVMRGKEALGSAFGVQLPGAAPSEVISKLGFQLATQAVKAISARPSQLEFTKGLQNVPGLAQSPQGRDALISLSMQQAQDDVNLAGIARASPNSVEFSRAEQAYYASHPLISPWTGKPINSRDWIPGVNLDAPTAYPPSTNPHVQIIDQGAQAAKPSSERPGTVKQGYVFKGGDPNQQENWQKLPQ